MKPSWQTDADNDSRDPSTEKQGMSKTLYMIL